MMIWYWLIACVCVVSVRLSVMWHFFTDNNVCPTSDEIHPWLIECCARAGKQHHIKSTMPMMMRRGTQHKIHHDEKIETGRWELPTNVQWKIKANILRNTIRSSHYRQSASVRRLLFAIESGRWSCRDSQVSYTYHTWCGNITGGGGVSVVSPVVVVRVRVVLYEGIIFQRDVAHFISKSIQCSMLMSSHAFPFHFI